MYSADASGVGEPMTKVFGFTVLLKRKAEKKTLNGIGPPILKEKMF